MMANQNKEKRNQSEINVIEERERGSDQKSILTNSWLARYILRFERVHSFKSFRSTSSSNFCSSVRGAANLKVNKNYTSNPQFS